MRMKERVRKRSETNCPNCGAPIEIYASKCPYCGTSYFDFSNIDVNDPRPIFLRIKMSDEIIVVPVMMRSLSMSHSADELPSIEMDFTVCVI